MRTYNLHNSCIWKIIHFNDNETFASAGEDSSINIYNYKSNRSVQRLVSHKGSVNDLVYIPNSNSFASSSSDTTVRLWSERTGLLLNSFQGIFFIKFLLLSKKYLWNSFFLYDQAHEDWVQPIIALDRGRFICSGGGDGRKYDKIKIYSYFQT